MGHLSGSPFGSIAKVMARLMSSSLKGISCCALVSVLLRISAATKVLIIHLRPPRPSAPWQPEQVIIPPPIMPLPIIPLPPMAEMIGVARWLVAVK